MTEVSDFAHFSPTKRARGTAVTIGNFDGCHLGHQSLIAGTIQHAASLGVAPVAVTFSPRPEAFFRGDAHERVLFTPEQKTRALGELGIVHQVVQRFDEAFSKVTHEAFFESYLKDRLAAKAVVVGDNFRFGHNRQGDASFLERQGRKDGIAVTVGRAASCGGDRISSTRIRQTLVEQGDMASITRMLGRPYLVEGVIRQGDQLGRTIGTPTANLEGVTQLLPRFGIFAGYVHLAPDAPVMRLAKDALPAVFSVGIRPTLAVETPPVRVEAFLLTGAYGANALYGRPAGYYFTHRIRDELKLSGLDELKAWIAKDVAKAKSLLGLS